MVCKKCGAPMAPEGKFCPECGYDNSVEVTDQNDEVLDNDVELTDNNVEATATNSVEATATNSVEATATNSVEATVANSVELTNDRDSSDGESYDIGKVVPTKKKKKGKAAKTIVTLLVVCTILCLCVVGVVFAKDSVKDFYYNHFASSEQYCEFISEKMVEKQVDEILVAYDVRNHYMEQLNKEGVHVNAKISFGSTIMDLLETATQQDFSWFKSISMDTDMKISDELVGFNVGLGLNDQNIGDMTVVEDCRKDTIYMQLPKSSSDYLYGSAEEIIDGNAWDATTSMLKEYPASKDVEESLLKYFDIIKANSGRVEVEKNAELTLNEVTKKCHKLRGTMTDKEVLNLCIALIEQAEQDETLKKLIQRTVEEMTYAGGMYEGFYYGDVYDGMTELKEMMKSELESCEGSDQVIYSVWFDKKGNLLGFTLESIEEALVLFEYRQLLDGNKLETSIKMPDVLQVTGTGTVDGTILNGTYQVTVEDVVFEVELKEFDLVENKIGHYKGTVKLNFPQEMYDNMDVSAMGIEQLSIQIKADMDGKGGILQYAIMNGAETVINCDLEINMATKIKFQLPSKDAKLYDANVDEEVMEYLGNSDLNVYIKALENAGLPSEYTSMLGLLSSGI